MKKITFTLFALVATICVMAQTKFWVCNKDSIQAEFLISNVDSISFTDPAPTDNVTDACGIIYPVVKIGRQYWMAENLRCSKYDTQSEAYNASWLTNNTVPTSESDTYTPYYTDASDKSEWYSNSKYFGAYLTNKQVAKLGYLYNWAAAVGIADGEKKITVFSGNRQGICPNGWHVPSSAEWQTLKDFIEKTDGRGSNTVCKHLKTTSGWYWGEYLYRPGLDSYGFAALPAGYAYGSGKNNVGYNTGFWMATPSKGNSGDTYCRHIDNDYDSWYDKDLDKVCGLSVRCLRD